jgi:hypothetical protein
VRKGNIRFGGYEGGSCRYAIWSVWSVKNMYMRGTQNYIQPSYNHQNRAESRSLARYLIGTTTLTTVSRGMDWATTMHRKANGECANLAFRSDELCTVTDGERVYLFRDNPPIPRQSARFRYPRTYKPRVAGSKPAPPTNSLGIGNRIRAERGSRLVRRES